jgi:hypothetical protein
MERKSLREDSGKPTRNITRGFFRFADVPSFSEPIGNVTAAIGKEVALSCTIRKVGNYKVSSRRDFGKKRRARDAARSRSSTRASAN